MRIIDRANIDNKNEAQRLVHAQNSGFGEKTRVDTRDATAVALPSSVPMNLGRTLLPQNLERPIAEIFRYAFVADGEGVTVIDITNPTRPEAVAFVEGLDDARDVFPARTYLYVAAGRQGLAVVDIQDPEAPSLVETFTAGGAINDATAVTTGSVNASLFAFVADGRNGLRVVRLIGPPDTPGHLGFSPRPVLRLTATYRTKGTALAVADGASRDRIVDESGNQISVMGRLGSRVLGREDRDKLLRHGSALFVVDDEGNVIFK